ncbi:MAG: membrane protein insertase YidC [Acidobacteria bacterium]|nr:membrane protein insertase YidC [Acidobacteriota bacterium]
MEKRTILAIALSFLVLMGFDLFYRKYLAPEQEPAPIAEGNEGEPQADRQPASRGQQPETTALEQDRDDYALSAGSDTKAEGPWEIVIQGEFYRAVVDNRGAVLESWILNEYKSSHREPSLRKPLDMIAAGEKGEKWPLPGSLLFEDPDLSLTANEELYEVSVNGRPYSGFAVSAPAEVVMTLRRGDLYVRKTYRFNNDNYTVDLSATFEEEGRSLKGRMLLGQDICPIEEHLEGSYADLKAAYFDGKEVERESAPGDDKGDVTISGNIGWVGLDTHYFTSIAIPERSIPSFEIRGYQIEDTTLDGERIERKLLSVKIPVDGLFEGTMYLGPKKQANLESVPRYNLSDIIDYGWFSIIARPLLAALRWIYGYANNYGLSIILLTLALSIVLFPLRLKQMLSMKKMSAIQPKVKGVQERYKKYKKTDPKRAEMNREIMALYKEHNVNPMSGCLPLLVQMPLLFAFYRLLAVSIELRQAPFVFWIQDLSVKDPYYIVPILMGVTMYLSQKMTPMAPTADSSQMKMMQYLPVIFTFMFLSLSSGLNLYFLCSNIFQVGFQKIAERWMGDGRNERKRKEK